MPRNSGQLHRFDFLFGGRSLLYTLWIEEAPLGAVVVVADREKRLRARHVRLADVVRQRFDVGQRFGRNGQRALARHPVVVLDVVRDFFERAAQPVPLGLRRRSLQRTKEAVLHHRQRAEGHDDEQNEPEDGSAERLGDGFMGGMTDMFSENLAATSTPTRDPCTTQVRTGTNGNVQREFRDSL